MTPAASLRVASLVALCLVGACSTPEPEIRGVLDRLVGEPVTIELVQGSATFTEEVRLTDAGGVAFDAASLVFKRVNDTTVTFTIPTGVAPGAATLSLGRDGEAVPYRVPLQLNRAALAYSDQGALELLPLPPATIATTSLTGGGTPAQLALSPGGGQVLVLSGTRLRTVNVGRGLSDVGTGFNVAGATCVATLPDGAVVGTSSSVLLLTVTAMGQITQQASFPIPGVRAIATDRKGLRAAVLSACDTNRDDLPDADCVTELVLGSTPSVGRQFVLDSTPSASFVALRSDGQAAVVADNDAIYGVTFSSAPPTKLQWMAPARPVGIDRGPSPLGDLFAIGDGASNLVQLVGFDGEVLKPVSQIKLAEPPTALAFGRRSELYVATGTKLHQLDAATASPTPKLLNVAGSRPILALQVQR